MRRVRLNAHQGQTVHPTYYLYPRLLMTDPRHGLEIPRGRSAAGINATHHTSQLSATSCLIHARSMEACLLGSFFF